MSIYIYTHTHTHTHTHIYTYIYIYIYIYIYHSISTYIHTHENMLLHQEWMWYCWKKVKGWEEKKTDRDPDLEVSGEGLSLGVPEKHRSGQVSGLRPGVPEKTQPYLWPPRWRPLCTFPWLVNLVTSWKSVCLSFTDTCTSFTRPSGNWQIFLNFMSSHSNSGIFHYFRVEFSSQMKSKIDNILPKTVTLRIILNIDDVPVVSKAQTHPSHSQTSRLLTSSPSLSVPVSGVYGNELVIHEIRNNVS